MQMFKYIKAQDTCLLLVCLSLTEKGDFFFLKEKNKLVCLLTFPTKYPTIYTLISSFRLLLTAAT